MQLLQRVKTVLCYRPRVHYLVVVALLALYFCFISNASFWRHVRALAGNGMHEWPTLFLISLPFALFFLMYAIMLILCSNHYLLKPIASVLLLTCAMATYATYNYGIIIDGAMLTNILQTNQAEALSYLSVSSIVAFVLLGLVPCLILWRIRIIYPPFFKSWLERLLTLALSLALAALCIFPYYQQYSFIGRDNKNLNKEILPVSYVYSAGRLVHERFFAQETPYVSLGDNATVAAHHKPRLLFLVLGETARAANFSALGYHRPTNIYTDSENVINFRDVTSCATATAYSVPCMFSNLTRQHYTPKKVENREGLMDVLQKAGIQITWLDNDDGCKGVCDRVKSVQISPIDKEHCNGSTCRDEVFLRYAKELAQDIKQDTVIAFHLIGSHGPRYYERYPQHMRTFTPDCRRPDVENCSLEEVVNSYDNSIRYTDYVIFSLIEEVLEQHMDEVDPMLLYVSDHGESLGENGIFLHAAPYEIAPQEQIKVPLQLWLPKTTAQSLTLSKPCLIKKAERGGFSHDNLFHTVLGLMQVKTAEYRPALDITFSCND